ncbi:MAG: site-specific integrase [Methylocella sp.]
MGFEWKAVGPFFGTKAAEILTEQDSLDYAAQRAKAGRRPSTIRTELAHLRSALLWAQKKKIIGVAPAIILPEASAPRDSRLTKSQAVKFIGACEMPHVRLFVILALTTGARMGAILGLKWDRVDFDQSLIYFEDPDRPKTNKRRGNPPMNKTARAALSAARAGATSPYVIEWAGQPVASVKKGLASAGERCGLPWVTAHVFRHSAATFMAEDRVSMAEIAQFLAHADSRLTERVYARFSPDHLREAADALEIDLMREAVPGMECSTVQLHRTTEQKRPKRDRKGE